MGPWMARAIDWHQFSTQRTATFTGLNIPITVVVIASQSALQTTTTTTTSPRQNTVSADELIKLPTSKQATGAER